MPQRNPTPRQSDPPPSDAIEALVRLLAELAVDEYLRESIEVTNRPPTTNGVA